MNDTILVEELTLIPIGDSKELGFKPIRIVENGRARVVTDAREIAAIKAAIAEWSERTTKKS